MRPIAWLRIMLAALAHTAVLVSAPAFAVCYTSAIMVIIVRQRL